MDREQKKAINSRLDTLISLYRTNHLTGDDTPKTTISNLVDALGADAAAITLAEMVNTIGDWDRRISRNNRQWAQQVTAAATPDELRAAGIFQPSEIHPAHVDQLASAMRCYTI